MSRLVIVHGVCWGAGQSTLSRRLAAAIPDVDVLWEDDEPAIFSRPEFAAVADRFHRHNAHPDAGIGHPPSAMLEAAYARLVETVRGHRRSTLMAWSPMDLAEDLDWAREDESALHRHALAVREVLTPLDPVLVFIDGDIAAGFDRAAEQRGRSWFARGDQVDDDDAWEELRARCLREGRVAADRIDRALDAGGWSSATVHVDGVSADADRVFDVVTGELRRRGVTLRA